MLGLVPDGWGVMVADRGGSMQALARIVEDLKRVRHMALIEADALMLAYLIEIAIVEAEFQMQQQRLPANDIIAAKPGETGSL